MAYVGEVQILNPNGSGRLVKRYVYLCDQCGDQKIADRLLTSTLQFCSRVCRTTSLRSGRLKENNENAFILKYGVKNPYASRECIEKKKETYIRNYGVDNPSKNAEIKEKKKRSFLKNFGVLNNFARESVRKSAVASLTERFGGPSPACDRSFVENVMKSPEYNRKKFESWKRNGSIISSKPERLLLAQLSQVYENVEQHVTINGWSIDIFVHDVDVYVQVDGVYWHGLKKPIDEIRIMAETDRSSRVILRKWENDRKQDIWFPENGLLLLRFTDVEINDAEKKGVLLKLFTDRYEARLGRTSAE